VRILQSLHDEFFLVSVYHFLKRLARELRNMRSVNVAEKLADRLALNPQEIVAMTGVGRNTIYAALVIGELRGKRIGVKKWIVPVDEIKRWLSEG
jgi:hypothetical protein